MEHTIIGLDPGTFRTGFGVLLIKEKKHQLVDYGVISSSDPQLEKRIQEIGAGLKQLYSQYLGVHTAIEKVFFGKNPDTAFKLGQIFGMCVYQAGCFNSPVYSYATRFIKQSVTGSGRADKKAVKTFITNIFAAQDKKIQTDAADAIAVALCHAYQKQNPVLSFKERKSKNHSILSRNYEQNIKTGLY